MSNYKFKKNGEIDLIELDLVESHQQNFENSSWEVIYTLKKCCPSVVNLCVECPPLSGEMVVKIPKCFEIDGDLYELNHDSVVINGDNLTTNQIFKNAIATVQNGYYLYKIENISKLNAENVICLKDICISVTPKCYKKKSGVKVNLMDIVSLVDCEPNNT